MIATSELLYGLPADLTLQFFAAFARFEFALKVSGCLTSDQPGVAAMASRDKLRTRLPPDFFEAVKQSGRVAVLIDRPPKNLLVQNNNHPQFGNQPASLTNVEQLLNATWHVRNNLFHGNKLNPANRERDAHLMLDVIAVIDLILSVDHQISNAFYESQSFF